MTVGENIRRIRQERNLTQRQLGEMVGASEAYIRAYESGRRNPKPSSLEKIADALSVNPEVLANSDFDGIKAIHRLFQIFRQYDGQLFEYQDKDGNDMVGISFGTLSLMRSWLDRYEEYIEEARSFFYSLLIVLTNAINPKDEASNKILEKATDNKLRYCNINIVSLYCATEFYSNLASLANDPIVTNKPYIYKEFVSNVLNGSSISYFFITENTPFRMLYIISQLKSDSEMAKNIIDDLNKSNGVD